MMYVYSFGFQIVNLRLGNGVIETLEIISSMNHDSMSCKMKSAIFLFVTPSLLGFVCPTVRQISFINNIFVSGCFYATLYVLVAFALDKS